MSSPFLSLQLAVMLKPLNMLSCCSTTVVGEMMPEPDQVCCDAAEDKESEFLFFCPKRPVDISEVFSYDESTGCTRTYGWI